MWQIFEGGRRFDENKVVWDEEWENFISNTIKN
jgi:hypothetical protein